MSFKYFYHNEFVHVLHSSTHRLFKRVDTHWIELCHPNEFTCFRLKALELAPSEVPRYAADLRPDREVVLPSD